MQQIIINTLLILIAIGLIATVFEIGPKTIWKAVTLPFNKMPPVVGYKQASLNKDGTFTAMVGIGYTHNAKAKGPGFHSFKEFKNAEAHEQQGKIMLEVLQSGKIMDHELGYTSSKQRVLQLIFKNCILVFCDRPSEYACLDTANQVVGYCKTHAGHKEVTKKKVLRKTPSRGLTSLFNLRSNKETKITEEKYILNEGMYSFSQLGELIPWLKESNVVVAAVSGENRFVPTKLS